VFLGGGPGFNGLGRTEVPGNFHLKPNGVFWIDDAGAPHVAATDSYLALKTSPEWATQSGPMLLIDGALHPAFDNLLTHKQVFNQVPVTE